MGDLVRESKQAESDLERDSSYEVQLETNRYQKKLQDALQETQRHRSERDERQVGGWVSE